MLGAQREAADAALLSFESGLEPSRPETVVPPRCEP